MRRQVVLFAEQDRQAAPRGVACDAGAVDPAAHDEQIVSRALRHLLCPLRRIRKLVWKNYRTDSVRLRTLMNNIEKVKFELYEH
jgi:hypothetical protein